MIEKIASPQKTKEILNSHPFVFQKKFGQNFLIDLHVLNKIISAGEITKDDLVIEIGPGIGSLTQPLAESAGKVIVIEIDSQLIPILKDTLKDYDNVEIIHRDVLKVDLKQLITESGYKKAKIVANLPYYITTPIIMGIFENHVPVDSVTVMVQKEVAERMQALPGTKDYGALSLAVQFYAKPYIVANVPANCFLPRPNVGSAVIRLTKYDEPPVKVQDEKKMFELIRAAFSQRRKTLYNSIKNSPLNIEKEQMLQAFDKMGLDEKVRGETLSLEQFATLSNFILSDS